MCPFYNAQLFEITRAAKGVFTHSQGSCHIAKVVLTIRHDSRQIPLAARHHTFPHRGFLPWRFAYAGPRVRRATFMGPPSANLHTPDSCIAANRGTRVSQVEFMSGWRKIVGCSRPPRSAGSHLEECNFLVAVVTLTSDCCGGRHRGRELRHNSSSAADRR